MSESDVQRSAEAQMYAREGTRKHAVDVVCTKRKNWMRLGRSIILNSLESAFKTAKSRSGVRVLIEAMFVLCVRKSRSVLVDLLDQSPF